MEPTSAYTGRKLDALRESLADAIVGRHYRLHPELEQRDGPGEREACRADAVYRLRYLAEAMAMSSPALFLDYTTWARDMLSRRHIGPDEQANHYRATIAAIKEQLPAEDAAAAARFVEAGLAELTRSAAPATGISTERPLAPLAGSYLAALLACDRKEGTRLIMDAVQGGTSIKDIYIHVFQSCQHEIGRLWQVNQVTVAQEHYCTAVTQMIMSQLYPKIFAAERIGRLFIAACVSGDLHEIGLRIVADFFEMAGWDTIYLGASVPAADLIHTLRHRRPDVVGISVTITPHIGAVQQMVSAIRAAADCEKIKILVGGYPFQVDPDLWERVGADGMSADAQSAVDLANELVGIRGAA